MQHMSHKVYSKHENAWNKKSTNAMLIFLRNIWCHDDDGGKESGSVSSMRTNNSYISSSVLLQSLVL